MTDTMMIAEVELSKFTNRIRYEFSREIAHIISLEFQDFSERVEEAVKKSIFIPPILPNNTKICHPNLSGLTLVIEEPPRKRSIKYSDINDNIYSLFLPFIVFVFNINFPGSRLFRCTPKVFCRCKPITAINDDLYYFPLTNVNPYSSEICMTSEYEMPFIGDDLAQQVEKYIGMFWQSVFTTDYDDRLNNLFKNRQIDFVDWEQLSKTNPLEVLDFPFEFAGHISHEFAGHISHNEGNAWFLNDLKYLIANIKESIYRQSEDWIPDEEEVIFVIKSLIEQIKCRQFYVEYENQIKEMEEALEDFERRANDAVVRFLGGEKTEKS
jgi:hypothetical protein